LQDFVLKISHVFCLILAVAFNVIVLGLDHMRATGDGVVHWDLQTNWTWFR
jgi:hypothetical protein